MASLGGRAFWGILGFGLVGALTLQGCGGSSSSGNANGGTGSGPDPVPSSLGDECVPTEEWADDFAGYTETEVAVEGNSPFCEDEGSVCLVNHFRGRVTCPYGQNAPIPNSFNLQGEDAIGTGVEHAEHCNVPGRPAELIQVPVRPQLMARPPENAVYCSCRCDGPDPDAEYCSCGAGFTCQELVPDLGLGSPSVGSYCVKEGTEVNNPSTLPQTPCSYGNQTCGAGVSYEPEDLPQLTATGNTRTSFTDQIVAGPALKLDLLFVIDNSPGMADKQQLLAEAIPGLIQDLANPRCRDADGNLYENSVAGACPQGMGTQFAPIMDVNLAVITSSMGAMGSTTDLCRGEGREDMAHLLGALPRGQLATGDAVADAAGFLAWRGTADTAAFTSAIQTLVQSAGEGGCTFEAPLESWYRFLVDPEPYLALEPVSCVAGGTDTNCRVPSGVDQTILDQRLAFLRPDSFVSVVVLSDENDCSVKTSGQAWYVMEDSANSPMWHATTVCETNPNDPCCYSCGQTPPASCTLVDASCGDPNNTREATDYFLNADGMRDVANDPGNLRCFQQKRRFGVDFLYPTQRYSNALIQRELCVTRNDLSVEACGAGGRILPNPLFAGLPGLPGERDPSQVFFTAVVGVPWHAIATSPDPAAPLEYQRFAELLANQAWEAILGDGYTPGDPLMQESVDPRMGTSPSSNQPLAGPDATNPWANPSNGHEWTNTLRDGLQPACAFPLSEPRDCTGLTPSESCVCTGAGAEQDNRAQCQATDGTYGPMQYAAVAYPGLRQLQVAKDFGTYVGNATVASICPRNAADSTAQDYGYEPVVDALVRQVGESITPRCLPRPLIITAEGETPCVIIEADLARGADCDCAANGRAELADSARDAMETELAQRALCEGSLCSDVCLCVIPQLEGAQETDCQQLEAPGAIDGWCYIDFDANVGNPALVERCPTSARRIVRFVGEGAPLPGTTTLISCTDL